MADAIGALGDLFTGSFRLTQVSVSEDQFQEQKNADGLAVITNPSG